MDTVTIGTGKLAGKGIYAARDFEKGELVVPYNFKQITQAEFDTLPHSEREWTHSFYGKIYHFPEPARYINHDDNPSTFPDLERQGNYALRPIQKGEAITIDDGIELQHELETFLKAYEEAANSRDFNNVAPFIADDAVFWFTNGQFNGKPAIQKAFEDTYKNIQDKHILFQMSSGLPVTIGYLLARIDLSQTDSWMVNGKSTKVKVQTCYAASTAVGGLCMSI